MHDHVAGKRAWAAHLMVACSTGRSKAEPIQSSSAAVLRCACTARAVLVVSCMSPADRRMGQQYDKHAFVQAIFLHRCLMLLVQKLPGENFHRHACAGDHQAMERFFDTTQVLNSSSLLLQSSHSNELLHQHGHQLLTLREGRLLQQI